jgi:hypothetical protein
MITGAWYGPDWGEFVTAGPAFRGYDVESGRVNTRPMIQCFPSDTSRYPFGITFARWVEERAAGRIVRRDV